MDHPLLTAFVDELEKMGMTPITRTGSLRAASAKLMGVKPPRPPGPPKPGSFGISIKKAQREAPERMSPAGWKQTAIDLPLVIGASGLGYGIGKTIADSVGESAARRAVQTGVKPKWVKHAPLAASVLSSIGAYALGRTRAKLKERRAAAEKRAGVGPAPQSRGIPRKKPSDPWRYDHRPAGIFGP